MEVEGSMHPTSQHAATLTRPSRVNPGDPAARNGLVERRSTRPNAGFHCSLSPRPHMGRRLPRYLTARRVPCHIRARVGGRQEETSPRSELISGYFIPRIPAAHTRRRLPSCSSPLSRVWIVLTDVPRLPSSRSIHPQIIQGQQPLSS